MSAGHSAGDAARRRREHAERRRPAALYELGADGADVTAMALRALPPEEWAVFGDLQWPGRSYPNVDHVVVGPPGVFVIDSKNWTGAIEVSDQVLSQDGRTRETSVAGVADAAVAVAELASGIGPELVRPVLCFARVEPLTGWARDAMICSTSNLVEMLLTRPVVLGVEQRTLLALELDAVLQGAAPDPVTPWPESESSALLLPAAGVLPARRRTRARSWRRRGPLRIRLVTVLVLLALALCAPATVEALSSQLGAWFVGGLATTHATPAVDGACPTARPVKAFTSRSGERRYRVPGTSRYAEVRAETCFDTAVNALAAGYEPTSS